jgi:ceramide glucosyltransferase
VRVPPDFLANVVLPLRDPAVGLVNCFYRLANPTTLPMQWEAIAINADFWSQVCQSGGLKPMDFALGAVMATTRQQLDAIGGFESLVDYLADDYQLGNKIARAGARIELCPVVVECREPPKSWGEVWRHQLRWARTIRVCQPLSWFFSILSNGTLWPLLWLLAELPSSISVSSTTMTTLGTTMMVVTLPQSLPFVLICWLARVVTAMRHQSRLTRLSSHWIYFWLVPIKDLLNVAVWLCSFLGSRVVWHGQRYRIRRGGKLVRLD